MNADNLARNVAMEKENAPDRKAATGGCSRELATLNAIASTASQARDLNQLLGEALDTLLAAMDVGGAERTNLGGCFLLTEDDRLVTRAECRLSPSTGRKLASVQSEDDTLWDASDPDQVVTTLSELGRSAENVLAEEGFPSAVAIPLALRNEAFGLLVVALREPVPFPPHSLELLTAVGHHLSLAIHDARLDEMEQLRWRALENFQSITASLGTGLRVEALLQMIADKAAETFAVPAISLMLWDEEEQNLVIRASRGLSDEYVQQQRIPRQRALAAARSRGEIAPLLTIDLQATPLGNGALVRKERLRSVLSIPLARTGQLIGALNIYSKGEIRQFGSGEIKLAQTFGNQAAIAIENARLYEETQRRVNELSLLHEVAVASASTLDSTEIMRKAAEALRERFDFSIFGFLMVDEEAGVLRMRPPLLGVPPEVVDFTIPIGQGVTGWVAQHGEPLLVADVEDDLRYFPGVPGVRSEMSVPLKVGGNVVGVLNVESTRPNAFSADDLRVLSTLASQLAVSIENARLFRETLDHIAEVEKLKEFNERIIENAQDIIYVHDLDGDFTFANQRATDILGYSREEVLELNIADVVAPEFLQMVQAKIRIRKGETVPPYEIEIVSKDGERIPVELSASPLEERGWIVGSVGIARDQREMRRIQAKLREKRDQLRAVFDGITDLLSVHAADMTVVMANRAWANRTGSPFQDIVGRKCHDVFGCHGSPCDLCPIQRTFESGEPVFVETQWPHTLDTVHTWSYPVRDSEGHITSVLAYTKIVTQQKELERQLLQAEKLSAIGQLVAGVAHELNNPLTSIMGYAELLQKADMDEVSREDLERIRREAERSARIVRNLLTFARRHEGIDKQPLDVNEVINRTLDLRAYQLKVDNIEVARGLSENMPLTMADADQLQQVFLNVISNAHQAMVEAHGRGRLIVRTFRPPIPGDGDAPIRIELIDDGPGIPPEDMNRVFDPFFTTKEVGQGVGLGLSIAYGIIEEHGGRIWVESPLKEDPAGGTGPGTRFVIELPVAAKATAPSAELQARGSPPSPGQRLILVVDDEPEVVNLVTRVLTRDGHLVHTASDGQTALDRIRQTRYDLIMSDLKMPGMSGKELYRRVQEFDPTLIERIIFFTGDTVSPHSLAFLRETGNVCLTKPFRIEDLVKTVRQALQTLDQ